jgi:hypothetical protein
MVKFLLIGLLSIPTFAQDAEYFIRKVAASDLRAIGIVGVPALARDSIQVFVNPSNADTQRITVKLTTRRNGVDRVYTQQMDRATVGWTLVPFEVDEVYTNLELTDVAIIEEAAPLAVTTVAAPLRVLR